MKTLILVVITAMCTLRCRGQAPQGSIASGIISGTVRGAGGSIIDSDVVSASGAPASVSLHRNARTSATAAIGPDGSFRFPPLVDGTYQLCTQTPSGWLSPCLWNAGAPTRVTLSPSQTSANVNIVLQKGAFVNVRVDDPGQFLSAADSKSVAGLLIGVSTDSFVFHTAALLSEDTSGKTYRVLIPFDRSIGIVVVSPSFQLTNASGSLLAASHGNAIPVLVPSGRPPPTVTLRVTGKTNP